MALIVVGALGFWALLKHRLATARFTEDIVVTVAGTDLSAFDLEHQLTEPLEQAVSTVRGVESIRTTITLHLVTISVRATAIGVDSPSPVTLVQEAVREAQPKLSLRIGVPIVQRIELDPPTRHFLARSDSLSRLELSRWLDEMFRREVEVQRGVRGVQLCGALRPELKVNLDQQRLHQGPTTRNERSPPPTRAGS